jgi:hypothetical protein
MKFLSGVNSLPRRTTIALLAIALLMSALQSKSFAATDQGVIASLENFYAPVAKDDCPNGMLVVTRADKGKFIEFDNFFLTVSNTKGKVLGSSYYETFATEDGASKIEMPVRICGDDPEYTSATELFTLQMRFVSSDRKFAQELSIQFSLIPVDAKAKAAYQVRKDCDLDRLYRDPYYINWDLIASPKVKVGQLFTFTGTLYRYGYPADFEKVSLIKKTLNPDVEVLIASAVTGADGKFKLSWKIDNKNYPGYFISVDERRRSVGPYFSTFSDSRNMVNIDCFSTCKYTKVGQLYDPAEGKPAKSTGTCAVTKHEYALVAANPSISYSGSENKDRNLWLKALVIAKNSITDPSILGGKQTSAFTADSTATKSTYYGSSVGGSVWVSGYMRNGHYVHGYSRRK